MGGIAIDKSSSEFDRHPPGGVDQPQEGTSSLFSFIRSKNLVSSKSQFVLFITPEIIGSASQDTEAIKRKFRRRGR